MQLATLAVCGIVSDNAGVAQASHPSSSGGGRGSARFRDHSLSGGSGDASRSSTRVPSHKSVAGVQL